MECSKCGAPGELAKLFDVISGEGIVKICQRCLSYENVPVVNRPTETQFKSILKKESVYKRLSDSAGINLEEHKRNIQNFQNEGVVKKQESTLRELIDKRFDFVKTAPIKKREDLIDNFHWIIMRARRAKRLTVPQLAKEMSESEKAIKLAEQGMIPEGNYVIIEKFEKFLGINILKPEVANQISQKRKQLGFDSFTAQNLTISDLQEMKKEVPEVVKKTPYWKRFLNGLINKRETEDTPIEVIPEKEEGLENVDGVDTELEFDSVKEIPIEFDNTSLEMSEDVEEFKEEKTLKKGPKKQELSQQDIDDILFGRK